MDDSAGDDAIAMDDSAGDDVIAMDDSAGDDVIAGLDRQSLIPSKFSNFQRNTRI